MAKRSVRTDRQAFWLEHLRACGKGSLNAYARAHGLEVRALYGAKARLKRQGLLVPASSAPARLVRVERGESGAGGAALCRVRAAQRHGGGVRLRGATLAGAARQRGRAALMRPRNDGITVYLCVEPVDFRKQINGLAALVQEVLEPEPVQPGYP